GSFVGRLGRVCVGLPIWSGDCRAVGSVCVRDAAGRTAVPVTVGHEYVVILPAGELAAVGVTDCVVPRRIAFNVFANPIHGFAQRRTVFGVWLAVEGIEKISPVLAVKGLHSQNDVVAVDGGKSDPHVLALVGKCLADSGFGQQGTRAVVLEPVGKV